jgi:hypothetical protein
MSVKQINEAVAKLHLEKGDALIVDGTVFDVFSMANKLNANDCVVFPVFPVKGQTIKQAFFVMQEEELKKATKEQIVKLLATTGWCGGHARAIIDGIEGDFCRCDEHDCHAGDPDHECAIHERCAVLRSLLKGEPNAAS